MGSNLRFNRPVRYSNLHRRTIAVDDRTAQGFAKMGRRDRLTKEEEDALAVKAAAGDSEAANIIAQHHVGLAVAMARAYAGRGVPYEDLVGAAVLAVIQASRAYSPIGKRFAAYATWRISGAIKWELANQQGAMGYKNSGKINSPALSVDKEIAPGLTIGETVVDDQPDADAAVIESDMAQAVRMAIADLPDDLCDVMSSRWLKDEPEPYRSIAARYGVTAQTIHNREAEAFSLLRVRHGDKLLSLLR